MPEHLEPTRYHDHSWGLTLWDDTGEHRPIVEHIWNVGEGAAVYAARLAAAYNSVDWGEVTPEGLTSLLDAAYQRGRRELLAEQEDLHKKAKVAAERMREAGMAMVLRARQQGAERE